MIWRLYEYHSKQVISSTDKIPGFLQRLEHTSLFNSCCSVAGGLEKYYERYRLIHQCTEIQPLVGSLLINFCSPRTECNSHSCFYLPITSYIFAARLVEILTDILSSLINHSVLSWRYIWTGYSRTSVSTVHNEPSVTKFERYLRVSQIIVNRRADDITLSVLKLYYCECTYYFADFLSATLP
jgi:hypothetical protein